MAERRQEDPGLVCLGAVTGARGLRGEVRIKCLAENPDSLQAHGPLLSADRTTEYAVTVVGLHKGQVIARIAGVADRDAAEALKGARLYLPREALPPTAEDEYYYSDLAGLVAELPDGTPLGTVRWVFDFGAGDVLEVTRLEGAPVMVPFTRQAVPVVDLAGGRLVVDPPPGLLDAADDATETEERDG